MAKKINIKTLLSQFDKEYKSSDYFIRNFKEKLYLSSLLKDSDINQKAYKQIIEKYVELSKVLKLKIEEITYLSETDILTKTNNRIKFLKDIKRETDRVKRYGDDLSLMILDIDFFKKVNDQFGHNTGDYILSKLSEIIKMEIRNTDCFARWGGEEFVLLLSKTSLTDAALIAEKHRQNIEKYNFEQVNKITISIGVAKYRINEKIDKFINRADNALYLAKENGRNCIKKEIELK
jgi:diguanylate cyclase (GGDEF)-like protein